MAAIWLLGLLVGAAHAGTLNLYGSDSQINFNDGAKLTATCGNEPMVRLQAGLILHSCGAQAVVVARVLHRLSQTTLVMVATARSGLRMARAVRVGSMSVCEFIKQTPLKFRLV